jgi:hypothetical protein
MNSIMRNQANGIAAMGIMVLIIGGGAAALAGYTFFVALPGTMSGITNSSNDVINIANALNNLASNIPCGNGCGVGGYTIIDLSSLKNGILGFANPMYNVANTLIQFRDTLFLGILTLLGIGVAIIFAGSGLMITAAAIRNLDRVRVVEEKK